MRRGIGVDAFARERFGGFRYRYWVVSEELHSHRRVLVLALQALASKLDAAGIPHKTVVESDPPWLGQVMAVGISPNTKEVLKKYLSSLPLLR